MLHDIGKIEELSEFPNNDYTDDGQLLGHIVIGTEMITDKISKIEGFPKQLSSLIKHSILAHHGEYEYGSPKRPKTIEAFILHCADNTDAKVKIYQEAIEADTTPGSWVGYNKMLAHNIRKTEI
jgi:3'-5' exoribonuclease